jgi:hypothetical protein
MSLFLVSIFFIRTESACCRSRLRDLVLCFPTQALSSRYDVFNVAQGFRVAPCGSINYLNLFLNHLALDDSRAVTPLVLGTDQDWASAQGNDTKPEAVDREPFLDRLCVQSPTECPLRSLPN